MNASVWISVAGGIAAQLLVAVWNSGRLAESVRNLRGWLSAVNEKVDDHETRISRIEGAKGHGR